MLMEFIVFGFVAAVFVFVAVTFAHVISGKDFWPFTPRGPLESFKECEWKQEAYREHAKRVPHPAAADAQDT